jgi:cholesterol oxidase
MQAETPQGHLGSKTAMFDFHMGRDISVLVGCGLGGTSLINANVALRAKSWVFEDERWPRELIDTGRATLDPYYKEAERMLGSKRYPKDWPELGKMRAMARSAAALGVEAKRPKLNVTFRTGPNAVGIRQHECVLCGDCVSGCNYMAKNTVLMNYLPYAHSKGVEIFTGTSVRTVQPSDAGWLVSFDVAGEGRETFQGPTQFVTARTVVLAAGTLGSTAILLRSRAAGLRCSPMLGRRFTGNGDVLGVAYDSDAPVHGIGLGRRSATPDRAVGPCIINTIDLTDRDGHTGLLIEDGSPPGAMASLLPLALWTAAAGFGKDQPRSDRLRRRLNEALTIGQGPYRGPVDRTLTYLGVGSDDDHGCIELEGDHVRVRWPGVGNKRVFLRDNAAMEKAAKAIGATYVPDPVWTKPFGRQLITVHPLGGCVMGDSAETGVVNHKSQVFSGESGAKVHPGLYVMDGSIIPRPLAVNPLLTISALAERAAELLLVDHP